MMGSAATTWLAVTLVVLLVSVGWWKLSQGPREIWKGLCERYGSPFPTPVPKYPMAAGNVFVGNQMFFGTTVNAVRDGLYVQKSFPPFPWMYRPLYIPWVHVRSITVKKIADRGGSSGRKDLEAVLVLEHLSVPIVVPWCNAFMRLIDSSIETRETLCR